MYASIALLLVLALAPGGFSPGTPVVPSPAKSNTSKLLFDLDCSEELLNV